MLEEKSSTSNQEIDLLVVFAFIKLNWKKIFTWGVGFGLIGAVYSLLAQKEFISNSKLLPELSTNSTTKLSGSIGALAGLAGIDWGNMGALDAIRPDLYPSIIQSTPFAIYILKQKIYASELAQSVVLENYLRQKEKSWFSNLFGDNQAEQSKLRLDPQNLSQAIELNKEEELLIENIYTRISASFDRKTSIITVSVKMPDPVVAASVANLTVAYLKNYITDYRTKKAKNDLVFIQKQVFIAKKRFQNAEVTLASFQDKNRFLVLQTAKIQEARLNGEFTTAQSVYNDLNHQYEQAKIKVQESTPVFNVYEPARIPLRKSEPKRLVITALSGIIGCIIATISLLITKK